MAEITETHIEREGEQAKVESWRLHVLIEAGFPLPLAERLERVSEREIERHAQVAATAFDERMREIREDAATRLSRELDRAVEMMMREELARRLSEG